ncbi:peamaclein-like [Oryza brachyantha]|uniref:Gibberellin regulated protein n=1 Tax=Oryza brachyantha TaxID=4533 RepID=J3LM10_ORYBR|nr:peamaclein-like [Oryza brachyantha]
MARFFSTILLLLALALVAEVSGSTNGGPYQLTSAEGSVSIQECPQKCDYRCSATKHREPCLKYCNICCQKCLCVPSGTYGHKEECPCYNNMKSSQGNPKCP